MYDRIQNQLAIFDLILLDYSMPVLDGPSTAKKILDLLKSQPKIKKPFICCVTAFGDDAHKMVAKESGMDLVMNKPLFKANIQTLLSRAGLL